MSRSGTSGGSVRKKRVVAKLRQAWREPMPARVKEGLQQRCWREGGGGGVGTGDPFCVRPGMLPGTGPGAGSISTTLPRPPGTPELSD